MKKQFFKTIYFNDLNITNKKGKTLTIAFNEDEKTVFSKIKEYSNQEIRELLKMNSYKQLVKYAKNEDRSLNNIVKRIIKKNIKNKKFNSKDITFVSSKTIPFQRWYPYIEGYSPDFVKSVIEKCNLNTAEIIFDPFAGTGTTIFAADTFNIKTVYTEINPLLQFIIQTKVFVLQADANIREELSKKLINISINLFNELVNFDENISLNNSYKELFKDSKYFADETYIIILKLRTYIDYLKLQDEQLANLLTIAVLATLLPVSHLKKAGDVRFKTKKELEKEKIDIKNILIQKIIDIAEDLKNMEYFLKTNPELLISNAKKIEYIQDLRIDAIITSPPYLNGTNYFRNTKLELWFLRYIQFENDLRYLRDEALTSGINDVKKNTVSTNCQTISNLSNLLSNTMKKLEKKSYDKRIQKMVLSYFQEMDLIFRNLSTHLVNNAKIVIDIGDSIFAGVHIKTDDILIEVLEKNNYNLIEKKILRKRRSKNKEIIKQVLLVLEYRAPENNHIGNDILFNNNQWVVFKDTLPHQKLPFSKRNWGHGNHSLCSYQGKLKPSIAYHLIKTFVPNGGKVLDPFSGVGTIPFEASLNGMKSYGIDISLPAFYISYAKVSMHNKEKSLEYINRLAKYIINNDCNEVELNEAKQFGFNKTLSEYYERNTLKEIILARRFLKENIPQNPTEMLVISSLLHILHGNRPYALSRKSHPIVPYAPTGEYIYKNLIKNLKEKVLRTLSEEFPSSFVPGKIFNQDSTNIWPQEINDLDAIITSPPFFDSTRFYLANWIRIWFSGWSEFDFKKRINSFIEEKQKKDFSIYNNIFRQSRERLKKGGVCVFHLGKSIKCDMASELIKISKRWFNQADIFSEDVAHCESHGIRDKGTVTSHQYLLLI